MNARERLLRGTLAEARALREQLRAELAAGALPGPRRQTIRDFALSWMRRRAARVRTSTAQHYADVLGLHVLPVLGDLWIDAVTRADVEDWVAEMARKARPATVNSRLRVLRSLLGDAADELGITDPSARVRALPETQRRRGLTLGELRGLLDAAGGEPDHYSLLLTLALTGMRWGEATALRWDDIDEQLGVIRIERSHRGGLISGTKTGSARTCALPDRLAEVLREHRRRLLSQQHPGLAAGLVFATIGRGGQVALRTPRSLTRAFARWCKAAGIERKVSPHDLRRTFVDLLRQAHVGAVVARSLVGHSTEAMRAHYSTVGEAEQREAVARVVRLVEEG